VRSVYIHFPLPSQSAIAGWLDLRAVKVGDNQWKSPSAENPVLYCSIEESYGDWEPGDLVGLHNVVPAPLGYVAVDVSGRVPGEKEVTEFTIGLLGAVAGTVATDDYSSHPWTLSEIKGGEPFEGFHFFDYKSIRDYR